MAMPRFFDSNGVGRFGVTSLSSSGMRAVQENSMEFTGLAFSVNAGITILSSSKGKSALRRVGDMVVNQWSATGAYNFVGDRRQMASYVDRFLATIRNDFPNVVQSEQPSANVIAETRRMGRQAWNGNLQQFRPKTLGGLYYNAYKVSQMARAGTEAGNRTSHEKKMAKRWRLYLFMFSLATVHELTHLFIAFLAQGDDTDDSLTPPTVSYLNYAGQIDDDTGMAVTGESGRWLESQLFGGSLEFYRDTSDDAGQTGIPHLLDARGMAKRISADCIDRLLRNVQGARFPLETAGRALSTQDRRSRGLLSLGTTQATGNQRINMRARSEGPLYNVSASDLNRVALEPRHRLRNQRVA